MEVDLAFFDRLHQSNQSAGYCICLHGYAVLLQA